AYDEEGTAIESNGSNEAPRPNSGNTPAYKSSASYYDASFVRLSYATLGFNFPENSLRSLGGIDKLRLYFTVQNAFIFTNFPGSDPESGRNTNAPMPRTFMLGLNLGF